ncbi:MAG TPA: type VI secretion system baseplate subunit TssG [Gemmatimonadaceae bacterium]|jgi:type VI secretion system protein ImpH
MTDDARATVEAPLDADLAARRSLLRALEDEPTSFSFTQTVRLLTRLWPNRAPLGGWLDPESEVVRFSVAPSLSFPPSEISALEMPEPADADVDPADAFAETEPTEPVKMTAAFFGLTGPQGVLPQVYTEYAASRLRSKDPAFRDFLDLFHHRAISLMYRVWQRSHVTAAYEDGRDDRMFEHLLDIAGLGSNALRRQLPLDNETFAFYAGVFAGRGRPADGLARLVADYFDVDASVEQFVGEWRRVDGGGQASLGALGDAGFLGAGVIGDAAWDPEARVRLRIGPLAREEFDSFLPGGDAHGPLQTLVRLYANDDVAVELQLVLNSQEASPCVLGNPLAPALAAANENGATRLGRGTWLISKPMSRDPDDTVFLLC